MTKLLAAFLAMGLAFAPSCACRAEALFFLHGPEGVTRYVELLPCPEARFDELLDDASQAKAAEALRFYFINCVYAYLYDGEWDHTRVILTEPYVFKTEVDEGGLTTIYCFGVIEAYALLRGDDGAQCFFQDQYTEGLYRVRLDSLGEIDDVQWVEDMDEELYPGAGRADEGYPGLTYELAEQIPAPCWNTLHIARQYLDVNGIDAAIVDRRGEAIGPEP